MVESSILISFIVSTPKISIHFIEQLPLSNNFSVSKYTSISCYTADYFSLTDNRPEDRTVFRVAHGETVSFSVGFLVFDEDAGGEYDLSTLYLTKTMGSQDFFAHLNVRE